MTDGMCRGNSQHVQIKIKSSCRFSRFDFPVHQSAVSTVSRVVQSSDIPLVSLIKLQGGVYSCTPARMAYSAASTSRNSCLQLQGTREVFLRRHIRTAPFQKSPVQARRTVREGVSNKSGPNWVLDEPKRLWEIGSRYW